MIIWCLCCLRGTKVSIISISIFFYLETSWYCKAANHQNVLHWLSGLTVIEWQHIIFRIYESVKILLVASQDVVIVKLSQLGIVLSVSFLFICWWSIFPYRQCLSSLLKVSYMYLLKSTQKVWKLLETIPIFLELFGNDVCCTVFLQSVFFVLCTATSYVTIARWPLLELRYCQRNLWSTTQKKTLEETRHHSAVSIRYPRWYFNQYHYQISAHFLPDPSIS